MAASKHSSSSSAALNTNHRWATLEPRVKQVSQSVIRKKWRPLPASSQEKVRQILMNLKAKRSGAGGNGRIPPIGKLRKKATAASIREEEYEKAVEEVADKLLARLPRMPFPPTNTSTVDDSPFDLSATLARITTLQSQLTTNLQTQHLLRRQINREKLALKRDRAQLKMLEDGFKGSEALRRKKERGLHPLVRDLHKEEETEDGAEAEEAREEIERVNNIAGICLTTKKFSTMSRSKTLPSPTLSLDSGIDPELNSLLTQLRNHLLSMQNNTASMQPVLAAMDEAKIVLDKFAARRGIRNSPDNT
ncbi:uncharacterized protein Z519_07245 [Cladophialophora bantiana CBS 173.52]|uniref:Uncharacterized protein n=1 Tax=Cladophialophora bantiana (strain ATCC 10958 / CBS 173.52 / CDC B-1940 / NIH 8579) TaxID=1442370 RepID=A0A0D2EQN3_CLAB1|nr:uncharacterized protein Z519_07245 [Cladophialophora bantiana CBS 173.52]KIW92261.1 hypothetical protein Z519_07245 [Cladophialophora bantiana CBS 173.52]